MTPEITRLNLDAEISQQHAIINKAKSTIATLEYQQRGVAATRFAVSEGSSWSWLMYFLVGLVVAYIGWPYLRDGDQTLPDSLDQHGHIVSGQAH
jgi:hypothetical protein